MAFDDIDALEGDDDENLQNTYLIFYVAGEEYAVHVSHVTEIVRIQRVFPVPDMPGYIRGVINLRGRVVPLLDVRTRFGLPQGDGGERAVVIVIEHEDATTGLVVDAVHEVTELPPATIEARSLTHGPRDSSAVITGMARRGDRVSFVLDVAALVTARARAPQPQFNTASP
jgi:purine-binding chemotaxis protein CheW